MIKAKRTLPINRTEQCVVECPPHLQPLSTQAAGPAIGMLGEKGRGGSVCEKTVQRKASKVGYRERVPAKRIASSLSKGLTTVPLRCGRRKVTKNLLRLKKGREVGGRKQRHYIPSVEEFFKRAGDT